MAAVVYRVRIPSYARSAFDGRDRVAQAFEDRAAAAKWMTGIRDQIQAARIGGERAAQGGRRSVKFWLACAGWLDQVDVRRSVFAWYQGYVKRRLVPAFGEISTSELGLAALTAYRVRRRDAGASPRTIEAELDVALRILRWARTAGYQIDETAFKVVKPKSKPRRQRRYEPAEVERFLSAARRGPTPSTKKYGLKTPAALSSVARRDTLVVEILRRTGLRAGELRAMSVEWIRWDERRLIVPHDPMYSPKGGKSRSIPLEVELIELLRAHICDRTTGRVLEPQRRGRPGEKPHFRGTGIDVNKVMDRLSAAAGVDLTAHDLRHYAISRWVDLMPVAGHSLADVQEWAGHASIRTTERYLHQAGGRWRAHAEGLDRASNTFAQVTSRA